MLKIVIAAMAAAAILAGVAVVVPGVSDEVEASVPRAMAKGDRLDVKSYGTACSQRGWPYYEADCLRNLSSPNRQAKPVRVVSVDRVAAPKPASDHSLVMRRQ